MISTCIRRSKLNCILKSIFQSASEYGYDLTLPVYGFDSKKICKSKIRENETKILFATLSSDRHRLMLSNTPLHITERNLDEVEALAHGMLTHLPGYIPFILLKLYIRLHKPQNI